MSFIPVSQTHDLESSRHSLLLFRVMSVSGQGLEDQCYVATLACGECGEFLEECAKPEALLNLPTSWVSTSEMHLTCQLIAVLVVERLRMDVKEALLNLATSWVATSEMHLTCQLIALLCDGASYGAMPGLYKEARIFLGSHIGNALDMSACWLSNETEHLLGPFPMNGQKMTLFFVESDYQMDQWKMDMNNMIGNENTGTVEHPKSNLENSRHSLLFSSLVQTMRIVEYCLEDEGYKATNARFGNEYEGEASDLLFYKGKSQHFAHAGPACWQIKGYRAEHLLGPCPMKKYETFVCGGLVVGCGILLVITNWNVEDGCEYVISTYCLSMDLLSLA
nr:hypothetical protein Iba_chr13aCG12500 [Ipomoea batatas]